MLTDDERTKIREAGGAAFALAVELRKVCKKASIRPADLTGAVDQLAIVMKNLEALNAKESQ